MARIALFGGSFDPPTVGHACTARNVLNSGLVDEVWFVPASDDRYDRPVVAQGQVRREMLNGLIADEFPDDPRLKIEGVQLERGLPGSATIDLLEFEHREHPEHTFFFVIGADNLAKVPSWREFSRLVTLVRFLAVPRLGEPIPEVVPPYVTVVEGGEVSGASSTGARELIERGEATEGVLSPSVRSFIEKQGLYRVGSSADGGESS